MATRGSSSTRRSATPLTSTPSLDSLLSAAEVAQRVTEVQDMWTANQEALLRAPTYDTRYYHPDRRYRPAPTPVRSANRNVIWKFRLEPRIRLPNVVSICVRRKIRREVLHALNRQNRKGWGSGRPRHRNKYTSVHC